MPTHQTTFRLVLILILLDDESWPDTMRAMRKPKLPSRKSMVRRLDAAFSLLIRARDGHKCVLCGSRESPTCGHVFSRVAYGTRWDDRNAFCQCAGCNMRHEFNPYPFFRYATSVHGQAVMDELQLKWNKPSHITNGEMHQLVLLLERAVRDLSGL